MKVETPFESMLRRYRGMLFHLCRRYSRRGLDVDDLMQEMALAMFQQFDRMPDGPAQAAWIWRVANNKAIDLVRATKQTETLSSETEMASDDRTAIHELRERIELLDEPDRSIVKMQLEGYSYEEIAAKLEMSEKNVSVRLVRVKEKLRKEFNR